MVFLYYVLRVIVLHAYHLSCWGERRFGTFEKWLEARASGENARPASAVARGPGARRACESLARAGQRPLARMASTGRFTDLVGRSRSAGAPPGETPVGWSPHHLIRAQSCRALASLAPGLVPSTA